MTNPGPPRLSRRGFLATAAALLTRGVTIGYRKLDRFAPVSVRRVRLHVQDLWGAPPDVAVALYGEG